MNGIIYLISGILFVIVAESVRKKVAKRNKMLQEEGKLTIRTGWHIAVVLSVVLGFVAWIIVNIYTGNEVLSYIVCCVIAISGILYAKKTYTKLEK